MEINDVSVPRLPEMVMLYLKSIPQDQLEENNSKGEISYIISRDKTKRLRIMKASGDLNESLVDPELEESDEKAYFQKSSEEEVSENPDDLSQSIFMVGVTQDNYVESFRTVKGIDLGIEQLLSKSVSSESGIMSR